MKSNSRIIILITICCFVIQAKAQLSNRIFNQNDSFYQNDTQTVRLHVEVFNFLRNTEYFDIIEKGQTLFGAMFQSHISYLPFKNLSMKIGFQTRQDYGSTRFFAVQPVLSISYFKHKWRYNFGALQGTTNYGFIEPMYNIDRAITNRIENGIQGIYISKKLYFNNFLIWDEPTYRTTTNQERFLTGFVLESDIVNNENIHLSLPLQGTLAHRGGQLNENPNPIFTRINAATGFKFKYKVNKDFSIKTENFFLLSGDFSPTITQPFKDGSANWHTLSFLYKHFEFMFNYWQGREYQSPYATQIYNNYNYYDVYANRQVRNMLMSKLLFTQQLNRGTMIDLRFEPFYDFEYARFQYNYSVYLKLNLDQVLFKIKNK